MNQLVFLDCETTGLHLQRRCYELALITRGSDGDCEDSWWVDVDNLDLAHADPFALHVGRFYERHPQMRQRPQIARAGVGVRQEQDLLQQVEWLTRGATLVGACPWFDAETLDRRMRAHGILPSWGHRLRCVESMVAGRLGRPDVGGLRDVATLIGLEVDRYPKHEAMADARLARDVYDAVVGGDPDA